MKLNNYQREWIKKLKSGATRKAKGQLIKSNRACCLGVAVRVCKLDTINIVGQYGSLYATECGKVLNLKDDDGGIDFDKVKPKWKKQLEETELENKDLSYSLVNLNDETNWSHVQIGKFIDENREAVFNV